LSLFTSLIVLTAAAWAVTLYQAFNMSMPMGIAALEGPTADGMSAMAMSGMSAGGWSFGGAVIFVAVWTVMMAAMMLPAAAPMIVIFASAQAQREHPAASQPGSSSAAIFLCGRRQARSSMSSANWAAKPPPFFPRQNGPVGRHLHSGLRWSQPGSISSRRLSVSALAIAARLSPSWRSTGVTEGSAHSAWAFGTAPFVLDVAGHFLRCW
jgi:hypothetical protein